MTRNSYSLQCLGIGYTGLPIISNAYIQYDTWNKCKSSIHIYICHPEGSGSVIITPFTLISMIERSHNNHTNTHTESSKNINGTNDSLYKSASAATTNVNTRLVTELINILVKPYLTLSNKLYYSSDTSVSNSNNARNTNNNTTTTTHHHHLKTNSNKQEKSFK